MRILTFTFLIIGFFNLSLNTQSVDWSYKPNGRFHTATASNTVNNGIIRFFSTKARVDYMNVEGRRVTQRKYDVRSGNLSEGLAKVCKREYWGFINNVGQEVIPVKYKGAGDFSEGLAAVLIGKNYGYINKKGKVIIQPQFSVAGNFSDGRARIQKAIKDRIYNGYINKDGVIEFYITTSEGGDFKDGVVWGKKGEKYGFYDVNGKIAIPFIFDGAKDFSEGLAAVKYGEKYGFINKNNSWIIPNFYHEVWSFSDGRALVKNEEGKYGYLDKKSKRLVISYQYYQAASFSQGLASVKKGDKYGYINKNGKFVIQPIFLHALSFSQDYAVAKMNNKKGYGIIKHPSKRINEPPIIEWTNPSQITTLTESNSLKVKICIQSKSKVNYQFFLDDKPVTSKGIGTGKDKCDYTISYPLNLKHKGIYKLTIRVSNQYNTIEETRTIHAVEQKGEVPIVEGRSYLMVIGINKYKHWPKLNNAKTDALAIRQVLTERYQFNMKNTVTILDEEATKNNILRELNTLNKKMSPKDNLLVFFSGHGTYDENDGGYWIAADAPLHYSKEYIPYDDINSALCNLSCQNVYLIADNCFAANLFKTGIDHNMKKHFKTIRRKRSRRALVAGTKEVSDGSWKGHSPFAQVLIDLLSENKKEIWTASFLEPNVMALVSSRTNGIQSPKYGDIPDCKNKTNDGGDFLFVLKTLK